MSEDDDTVYLVRGSNGEGDHWIEGAFTTGALAETYAREANEHPPPNGGPYEFEVEPAEVDLLWPNRPDRVADAEAEAAERRAGMIETDPPKLDWLSCPETDPHSVHDWWAHGVNGPETLYRCPGHSQPVPVEDAKGKRDLRWRRQTLTTDRSDPRLTHGTDDEPVEQAAAYLVLSADETAKGYVRPFRTSYIHETCGAVTRMGDQIAATYARDPRFYGGTYCATCRMHKPVGEHGEFIWDDGSGQKVGT